MHPWIEKIDVRPERALHKAAYDTGWCLPACLFYRTLCRTSLQIRRKAASFYRSPKKRVLQSALWGARIDSSVKEHAIEGTAQKKPLNLRLGFASEDLGYMIDLGLPPAAADGDRRPSAFFARSGNQPGVYLA